MQNIIDFCKRHKIILLMTVITALGFLFRLDYNITGLTNDEIATLRTSLQSFPYGIINALISKNFHAPFYYFSMHFWIKLFGTDVFTLRLLPILLGTACIPVSYLCGKKLSSQNLGLITAILVTINPFSIAFSHFSKFYSLIELLGFLSILFLIKIKTDPKILNIIMLAIVNALIVYTYVLGFLFVLIQFVFFSIYLLINKEKEILKHWLTKYPLILLLLTLPIIKFTAIIIAQTQHGFLPTFWWYNFRFDDIYNVIYSWFSPGLPYFYIEQAGNEPTEAYFSYNLFFIFCFNILPLLIMLFGTAKTLKKKNFVSCLFYISLAFILAELIAAIMGKFAFCSRYTMLAFPAIIVTVAYGLSLIKNKTTAYSLMLVMFLLNCLYKNVNIAKFYNTSPSEVISIAKILNNYSLTKKDFVIVPFRGYYLETYFDTKDINFISFDINYSYKINDKNILRNILDEKYTKSIEIDPYERFNDYIRTKTPSKQLSEYLNKACFSKLDKNGRVYLVLYQPQNFPSMDEIINDENIYKTTQIFYLLLAKINYDLISITSENLKFETFNLNRNFNIYVYSKY